MNVVVLSRGIPCEKYKLHGIFEFDQAKALAKAGCRVAFAVVDIRSLRRWRKWGIEQYERDGMLVFRINIPGGRLPKSVQNGLIKFGLRTLYPLIERKIGKPDIIHSHFTALGYAAASMKEEFCVPLVVTEHSSEMLKVPLNKKLRAMAQKAYSSADAVVAVSPSLVAVIQSNFGITPKYIPNIVDTELFSYIPRELEKKFYFISVGNLIKGKRMDLTIRAFAEAFEGRANVSLAIVGEGPERPPLERLIKSLGQVGRVSLLGLRSRAEIGGLMAMSNCFVLPSHQETFGVVYIEALAAGLPIIATRCGGPEHFINEHNGLLIPVDDKEALVNGMEYMYHNAKRFNGMKMPAEAKRLFAPDVIARQLKNLYGRIAKNG